uniref:Bromodomain adjacent to zinc finger domain protein 2B n=1 Tax=Plectus sambesii TaxID=2011161 RepID=A0A914XR24_9BILA
MIVVVVAVLTRDDVVGRLCISMRRAHLIAAPSSVSVGSFFEVVIQTSAVALRSEPSSFRPSLPSFFSSTMGDQEQQQQLLAAAFAAQSQMAAAYGPMAGVYNPYAMYNGFFGGGNQGWPSASDYLMWSAAMQQQQQQQQQQQALMAAVAVSSATSESFEEVLRKMSAIPTSSSSSAMASGAHSSSAATTTLSTDGERERRPNDKRSSSDGSGRSRPPQQSPGASASSAKAAGGKNKRPLDENPSTANDSTDAHKRPRTHAAATAVHSQESHDRIGNGCSTSTSTPTATTHKPQEAIEPGEIRRAADGRKVVAHCDEKTVAVNGSAEKAAASSASTSTANPASASGATAADAHHFNPDLIEASARAWALMSNLSNQLMLGMQQVEAASQQQQQQQQQLQQTPQPRSSKKSARSSKKAVSDRDSIASSMSPVDALDDTINSVIRSHNEPSSTLTVGHSKKSRSSGHTNAVKSTKATVREQLALRKALKMSPTPADAPLDLSQKASCATPLTDADDDVNDALVIDESATPSLTDGDAGQSSSDHDGVNGRKRPVADATLVRVPLAQGWRRQTCIRSISSTGVRGDVIYNAPCGKRLGSYAEVLRYLNKRGITDITRDNFSFSCKVLVGEFLQIKGDAQNEKGIVKLTEDEVLAMIAKLGGDTNGRCGRRSVSNGTDRRHSKTTVVNNHEEPKSTNALTSSANKKRPTVEDNFEREMRAQTEKLLESMRMAKEHEDQLRQQQLQFLQKQGEEYYRQMLLVGLEQQLQAARAAEMSKQRQAENRKLAVEKVLKQEEQNAIAGAKNALVPRLKQARLPVDDLFLDDPKDLPELNRIEGLALSGQAFADVLMVIEFVQNFGHVLKIEAKDIPSISEVHAGLLNDPVHIKSLRKLTKVLVTLVLEYPGLPTGPQGRTFLGQLVKDVGLNRDNYSELLKMFLCSRDQQGIALGAKLESSSFESLDADTKAAMLAYMCNELLYCRNVVREIEGNIEDVTRLRGEKWMREGKVRLLRGIQAKKRMEAKRAAVRQPLEKIEVKLEPPTVSDEPAASNRVETPASTHSDDSIASDKQLDDADVIDNTAPPSVVKQEDVDLSAHPSASVTPALIAKPTPPGISQYESITEEEKALSADELENVITRLSDEATELRDRAVQTAWRVRALPYGQDRFHRLYWALPHAGVVVVESAESVQRNNAGCDLADCADDSAGIDVSRTFADPEIVGCLEDVVDRVCRMEGSPVTRRLPNRFKRGWWSVPEGGTIEKMKGALHGRGIRERMLHRALLKYGDQVKRTSFDSTLKLDSVGESISSEEAEIATLRRFERLLQSFEDKIIHANVHNRQYGPGQPINSTVAQLIKDDESGESSDSKSSWSSSSADSDINTNINNNINSNNNINDPLLPQCSTKPNHIAPDALLASLKRRLLSSEYNIERRYLQSPFHMGQTISPERVLGLQSSNGGDGGKAEASSSMDDDNADLPVELERWRLAVTEARTAAQLMLCLQQLDSTIAWDKSIMRASCQICRSAENENQLLLCDCCDMGYHMYCFKPKLTSVPEGDWFCPSCIGRAADKPCCLVCVGQTGSFLLCSQCENSYHADCINSKLRTSKSDWVCTPCIKLESQRPSDMKSIAPVGENGDASLSTPVKEAASNGVASKKEKEASAKKAKKPVKRKVTPPQPVIPKEQDSNTPPVDSAAGSTPVNFADLCSIIMAELDAHKDSQPFKLPVDFKAVPLYKKIIRKPIDLSVIRNKLAANKYETEAQFCDDVKQMFDNCKIFNEDDSAIGKAGTALRRFFNRRWKELKDGCLTPTTKRARKS